MDKKAFFCSFFLLFLFAFVYGGAAFGQMRQAQQITGDRFDIATRTPRGATVYAVTNPTPDMLNAIDRGLTELFAVARRNGYSRLLNYSNYTIFIAHPDRTQNKAGEYSADITVGAAQYSGTDYDQGGYIWAAGMVLTTSPASFVIAEHTQNLERVTNLVRYEGEHLVLYHNDRKRYQQTMDHSQGGSHPILQ